MPSRKYKIVYCTPALYMAGGVERVLTLKANYFVEHFGYDITVVLTEGKNKPFFYPLSDKIKIVNLDINFEDLWKFPFLCKIFVYMFKQYRYRHLLTALLMRVRPDITISLLRRDINFVTSIKDGSKKVGELHINRANYRNFSKGHSNLFKWIFSFFWKKSLVRKLRKLDHLVVLTENDKESWVELNNVSVIPNPLSFGTEKISNQTAKSVISVGRYSYEKGYDLLLQAWARVQNVCEDWTLRIYGDGDKSKYERMIDEFDINRNRCILYGTTRDVQSELAKSSLAVCSSRFEGFGMFILEAMACGLPVVSFDCPWGPRSIILDNVNGILIENENVDKLAEALIKLIFDDKLRYQMANNATNNIWKYKIDAVARKWKSLFDGVS